LDGVASETSGGVLVQVYFKGQTTYVTILGISVCLSSPLP